MNARAPAITVGNADGSEVLPRLKRSVLSKDTTIAAHHVTLLDAVRSRDPTIIARETTNHICGISSAFATELTEWAKEHAILVGDPCGIASQQSTAARE
jgi:hypothetical protein